MPIRPCSKCGLKVLVTESQVAAANFLCQRCSGSSTPAAPPKPAGGSTRSAVKVNCPFCKATFSGSIPSKPAKGSCPVCRKDLILLPDGTIQPAAAFDLAKWQASKKPAAPSAVEAAFPEPAKLPASNDDQTLMTPGKLNLGDQTMLGMGDIGGGPARRPGAPAKPAPAEDIESMPVVDHTMLGMGGDLGGPRKPAGSPPPELESLQVPSGLGDHTMLGMGDVGMPKLPNLPGSEIESMPVPGGMGDHTMLGMGGAPEVESIPMPADMSDQTMLDMGGMPAPPPAKPILAPKPVKAIPTPAPPRRPAPPPKAEPDPNDITEVSQSRPTARPVPGLVREDEALPEAESERNLGSLAKPAAPSRPARPAPPPTAVAPAAPSTPTGKLAIGWALVAIPLLAGLIMGLASGSLGGLLDGVSKASLKGFQKLNQQIRGK